LNVPVRASVGQRNRVNHWTLRSDQTVRESADLTTVESAF
jgi:hypothetical protein